MGWFERWKLMHRNTKLLEKPRLSKNCHQEVYHHYYSINMRKKYIITCKRYVWRVRPGSRIRNLDDHDHGRDHIRRDLLWLPKD